MGKSNADRQRDYRDRQREARAHAERQKAMAVLGEPQGPLEKDGGGPKLGGGALLPQEPAPEVLDVPAEPLAAELLVSSSSKPIPPPSTVPPPHKTLQSYVEEALLGAEIAHPQIPALATLSTKTLAGALERAEAYARWRYQGVQDGTINGL